MSTVYDWIALTIFCGLAVLFLQRSMAEHQVDTIWHYVPPSAGCILTNYFGNEGHGVPALTIAAASIIYIFVVLKPAWPKD